VLATYGRLVAATRGVEPLADVVADHLAGDALTWDARGELAEHVAALKVVATDVALDVTNTIFEVTGARATSNAVGLDRFWRNVRTYTLHDPVAYKRREVGDHFLNGTHPAFTLYT
jgi:alkylation response protein AidB-like acyl-CoA dehydrogenase